MCRFRSVENLKVNVSSAIDKALYDRWKRSGMRLNHVINLGLMAAEQTPGYLERIRELEEGNAKLQQKLTLLYTRIVEMENGKGV